MNKIAAFACLFPFLSFFESNAENKLAPSAHELYFLENKGQITDRSGHTRNDIQYALQAPGIDIFAGKGRLHYQFIKRETCGAGEPGTQLADNGAVAFNIIPSDILPSEFTTYRMDVELVDANQNAEATASEQQAYYEIYFGPGAPISGTRVHSYRKITYKNVYPDIDWVIYIKGNKLEQAFVIGPNGDASRIRLKYNGQTDLHINEDGSIAATTPMGLIKESEPVCYMPGGTKTTEVTGAFRLNGNILSYDVNSVYQGSLVIDPTVEWATYYGPDSTTTSSYDVTCDPMANVYLCGLTYSSTQIATTGAYSDIFSGVADAYLVKFDSSGHRLWGTYYGGSTGSYGTWGAAVACDGAGNIYLSGSTSSLENIATPGAQEVTYGGGLWCGYLVKFDSSGSRKWGTYVGGTNGPTFDLEVASVVCDNAWHVYVSGSTDDSSNIGTPGTWKPYKHAGADTTIDDYLIQYDSAGVRQWGTYYGEDFRCQTYTGASCSDGANMYLSGWTNDTLSSSIATPGSHMATFAGTASNTDAFLVKFDATGNRVWGTYYGGSSAQTTGGVAFDGSGNVFLLGTTQSDTGIASPGCFQPLRAGSADAFLAKFDIETGVRIWATYYGGPGTEDALYSRICSDDSGNVYITGYTNSTTGISSTDTWQAAYGGGDDDAFFAKYNEAGVQEWATYYGGSGNDVGRACAFDGSDIYLCGYTNSPNNIATFGSFDHSGVTDSFYYQSFLAKFSNSFSTLPVNKSLSDKGKIGLYPTPNNGSFTLSGAIGNTDGTVCVTIYDMAGSEVLEEKVKTANGVLNERISLSNSPQGVYILRVVSQEGVSVLRYVVE